jgi:hypothetical protein
MSSRGVAGHRGADACELAERLGYQGVAQVVDGVSARRVVAEAGEREAERERPAIETGPDRERRVRDALGCGEGFQPLDRPAHCRRRTRRPRRDHERRR